MNSYIKPNGGGGGGGGGGSGSHRLKLGAFLHSDPALSNSLKESHSRPSNSSLGSPFRGGGGSGDRSPDEMTDFAPSPSPYIMSPYAKSPWSLAPNLLPSNHNGLIYTLVREEGHVYSLAASDDFLFTGSESKNIRVWKQMKEFSGFKSNSGLVKAIVIAGDKIFTGHQDGKIRVWKFSPENTKNPHRRLGTLPRIRDYIKSAFNPNNYVQVRRHVSVPWIKHYDAVSCMSLDEKQGILYSGSWDKTFKVWRLSDSKCLESVIAHHDAVNSIVTGFDCLVFTGSADGTVKVWRRELMGKTTKHVLVQTLLEQESAVTALATVIPQGLIYSGSSDGLVNFWESKKRLSHGGVLHGHRAAVLCLSVAGNLVLSGSADKSICVWKRNMGGDHSFLSMLTGHGGPIKCLVMKEDCEPTSEGDRKWTVYSGSLDNSVKVWRVLDEQM
ncbi:protein JINGUBANG-like [Impatiens glandulifera]|uniref:protein JINGUBANG-like n=1 Tax=Impatiens glandulifera TaxID=253017 RepID=UPI001FB0BBFF|nr:protein JINGUBANG-like [Impatiens glandulifera]